MSSTTDKTDAIIPGGPAPLLQPPGGAPDDGSGPAPDQYPNPAEEDRPLADRLGRDPSNLGTDIRDEGDLVHPTPEPGVLNM